MSIIERDTAISVSRDRRHLAQVIDLGRHSGPSRRGSSYYKTLLACPREFALSYEIGINEAFEREPLVVGTLFHRALEYYYAQLRLDQQRDPNVFVSREGMVRAYESLELVEAEPGYEKTGETVRRVLDGYWDEYADERLTVLAAEETLEFVGAFEYTARLDTCVVQDGGFYVCEHKSARAITDELLGNYEMDIQILGQAWLVLNVLDLSKLPPFRGIMINIATKHAVPRYHRHIVYPSTAHLQMFERAVFDLQDKRRWAEARNWPMSLGHCSGYARGYSSCQFYQLCHNEPDTSVAQWRQLLSERGDEALPLGYRAKEETDDAIQERA